MLWMTILGFLSAGAALGALAVSAGAYLGMMIDDSLAGDEAAQERRWRWCARSFRIGGPLAILSVPLLLIGGWPSSGVEVLVAIVASVAGFYGVLALLARRWAAA